MFIIRWPLFWPYCMTFNFKPVKNDLYLDLLVWPWPEIYYRSSGMFENHIIESNIIEVGQVVPEICHFLYFPWVMAAILDFGPYRCLKICNPRFFLVHTQIKSIIISLWASDSYGKYIPVYTISGLLYYDSMCRKLTARLTNPPEQVSGWLLRDFGTILSTIKNIRMWHIRWCAPVHCLYELAIKFASRDCVIRESSTNTHPNLKMDKQFWGISVQRPVHPITRAAEWSRVFKYLLQHPKLCK